MRKLAKFHVGVFRKCVRKVICKFSGCRAEKDVAYAAKLSFALHPYQCGVCMKRPFSSTSLEYVLTLNVGYNNNVFKCYTKYLRYTSFDLEELQ